MSGDGRCCTEHDLRLAISDPGATVKRLPNENVTHWSARAVLAAGYTRPASGADVSGGRSIEQEFAVVVAALLAGRIDGQQAVASLVAIHERLRAASPGDVGNAAADLRALASQYDHSWNCSTHDAEAHRCSCGSQALYAEQPRRFGPHHYRSCARWRPDDGCDCWKAALRAVLDAAPAPTEDDHAWTVEQHHARGMVDALSQTHAYLTHHGPDDLGEWLKRRERGYLSLLPTDEHGNTQFTPTEDRADTVTAAVLAAAEPMPEDARSPEGHAWGEGFDAGWDACVKRVRAAVESAATPPEGGGESDA